MSKLFGLFLVFLIGFFMGGIKLGLIFALIALIIMVFGK